MIKRIVLTLVVAALVAGSREADRALAASPAPSPSATAPATPAVKRLDTQIVTAARHAGTIGSTSRETWVLSAADLLRVGAASVGDALRFVPGVTVKDAGLDGSLQTVAMRGTKSEQTLVLVDGRPINDPDTGAVDFSSLPVSGISRIEVVEGGSSTLYGSSAIGGVINIITVRPAATASSAFAQVGFEGAVVDGFSTALDEPSTFAVTLDARTAHSRGEFDFPAFGSIAAGTRANSDAKLADYQLGLSRDVGTAHVRLRLSDGAQDIGVPGDLAFGSSPLARQQRVFNRSDLTIDIPAGRDAWTLQVFADGRRLHFAEPVPANPSFGIDALDNSTSRGFSVRDSIAAGSANIVTVGYDSRGDRALFGGLTSQPAVTASDATTAWYVADDVHAPGKAFSASLGLRNERPQGTAAVSVPTIGVSERLGGIVVRANYARAFRTPDLNDRYFPFAGNPLLQPEYAATFDAGVTADLGRASASLSWFGSDTNNLIVFDPQTFLPRNIARASVRGGEAETQFAFGSEAHGRLSYTAYPRAADLSAAPGTRLYYRPTATGSAELWRAWARASAGVDLSFTGRRYANPSDTVSLPAYATLGAFVERPIGRGMAITVRAANLTGQRVQDTYGYPVLGTTFSVRLSTMP